MEEKQNKPKKPFYKRWWFITLIVIIVIGVIGSTLNESDENDVCKTNGIDNGVQSSSEDKSKESKKDKDEKLLSAVGDSITTKNFVVTLEKVNKLPSSDFNKPADGKEFVELVLVIENISSKEYSISSILMFDAYEDGFSINESLTAQIASKIQTMDGALAAGKKMRGKLAYELSKEWKELEIDIDLTSLSFSTDGEIKIKIQNQ